MGLQTLKYSSEGRPQIINADFVPTDLADSGVQILVTRKMNMFLHANAMRAVCDHRGHVVARFKPNVHPHFSGDDDFPDEAA